MLQIQGARTQHLWDGKTTALFCTEKLTKDQAVKMLSARDESVVELLYVGETAGWSSLLRSEMADA